MRRNQPCAFKAGRKSGTQNRRYNQLEAIYLFLVENVRALDTDLEAVNARWDENERRYKSFKKPAMADAMISPQLASAHKMGEPLDPEDILQAVVREIGNLK